VSRIVLDTNVLVSFLTDRDPAQQARAAKLFAAAASGADELVLHQMVVSEMVYVLTNLYRLDASTVAAILADLLALPGVRPLDSVDWPAVLELWPGRFTDFTDACLAAVARQGRFDAVATFDRPFARRLAREGLTTVWN
jgi:predicted nucleic acid-binding protein